MSAGRLDPERLLPWCEFRFDRSGGPGGQNVNKVATRATLYFDLAACPLFEPFERERIAAKLRTRLARDGRVRVVSARHRDQRGNRAAAQERLAELLSEALERRPERRPTRPTRGSQKRRLEAKRRRGESKAARRERGSAED